MPAQITGSGEFGKGAKIAWLQTGHPVFSGFGDRIFEYLETVSFSKYCTTSGISGDVLARLDGDAPVIIEKKSGKGTVFLCPFAPDPSWTNFPEKAFFPVFINSIVSYLAGNEFFPAFPGETIPVAGTWTRKSLRPVWQGTRTFRNFRRYCRVCP